MWVSAQCGHLTLDTRLWYQQMRVQAPAAETHLAPIAAALEGMERWGYQTGTDKSLEGEKKKKKMTKQSTATEM